jgi:D-alanine-D-alanine ligase
MATGTKGFVPVLHAATQDRPDEIDTLTAAEAVATAVKELGYSAEIVALSSDLAEIEALPARRPLLVFNLVDAVNGDGKLAPLVPARLDASGIRYTGSLGLDAASVVPGAEAPQAIAERNARWQTEHFAEAYVGGREFNVSMLGSADGVEVLPIAEIIFEDWQEGRPRIVDYEAKWVADSTAYAGTPRRFGLEETAPALAARLTLLAQASWILFGLSSYARIDFRVDAEGRPYILEVNVNPCLSPDAGFAAAAGERGLAYEDMIGRIVEASRGPLHVTT